MARKRISENNLVVSTAPAVRRKPVGAKRVKRPAAAATAPEPSHDEIARLAYSYWEARGCQGGSSEEDWARAQRELRGV